MGQPAAGGAGDRTSTPRPPPPCNRVGQGAPSSAVWHPAPRSIGVSAAGTYKETVPPVLKGPAMKIHEYQAKQLLAAAGAPVPKGVVAASAAEAQKGFDQLGGAAVVKAQVHAGGRG